MFGVNQYLSLVNPPNITLLTSFVYCFQEFFKTRNGCNIRCSYFFTLLCRLVRGKLFVIAMPYFCIACSVEEGVGDGFNLRSGDPNFICVGLMEDAMRKSLSTETFTKQMPTKLESLDLKSKQSPTPSFTELVTPK